MGATQTLYQVGFIGTASGTLRTTKAVARVRPEDEEGRTLVISELSNERLGYAGRRGLGFDAYETYDGILKYLGTFDSCEQAVCKIMGQPGRGYDHYSFNG